MQGLLGQGIQEFTFNQNIPQLVEKTVGLKFVQMSVGDNHVMGVTEEGEVYSWGTTENYKLGHSQEQKKKDFRDRSSKKSNFDWIVSDPTKIEGLKDIVQAECGVEYSVNWLLMTALFEQEWGGLFLRQIIEGSSGSPK